MDSSDLVRILVVNPGSTTTKIAIYENTICIFLKTLHHSLEDLAAFPTIADQYEFRKNAILKQLEMEAIPLEEVHVVIGRGGLTYPLESGVYQVNELMVKHCREGVMGMHASNLGSMIAFDIAAEHPGMLALIADPVVTDEMDGIARVSGHPLFTRRSIFHALNQKAVARQHAMKVGKSYEDLDLIVVHLGGGISVGVHQHGRVIDVNNALDGEGPFSPERSGSLPVGDIVRLCFSGDYTFNQVMSMISGQGGMVAYLGTNDAREVEIAVKKGDEQATFYHEAMAYQISKYIGEMSTVLKGRIDGILITGGIAFDKKMMSLIRERVEFIAPVSVYAGQDELKALAMNALMVARGEVEPRVYDATE
ncbi:MAG: butyrate kinase [Marinilabiliales bacterium]|nr:butyrate kinase [Marinilabiliales bacterium]